MLYEYIMFYLCLDNQNQIINKIKYTIKFGLSFLTSNSLILFILLGLSYLSSFNIQLKYFNYEHIGRLIISLILIININIYINHSINDQSYNLLNWIYVVYFNFFINILSFIYLNYLFLHK